MALKNLASWNAQMDTSAACGAADKPVEQPATCGAGDK